MMKSKKKLACALAALAVGAMACAEDVSLAQWRMAMATNGHVAVKGRVKVPQDVRQSIWKVYREHIGYEGVQMSTPRLVSTNEFGAVYDLPFTTADGAKHNFCLCKNRIITDGCSKTWKIIWNWSTVLSAC